MMTRQLNGLLMIVVILSAFAICVGNTTALEIMGKDNSNISFIDNKTDQINNIDFNLKELQNLNKIQADKQYISDEIIVKFKGDREPFRVIKVPEEKVGEKIKEYSNRTDVVYAEPNYIAYALMVPNDTYYNYQWHLDNSAYGGIQMEQAWDISTGTGTVVAVVDTGIRKGEDLANTCFIPGFDYVNNDADPIDDNGHGTHVAGTVAQRTNNALGVAGVAFNSCLMPVKVLGSKGSGTYANIALGIRYAADNRANVISLSLGGSSPSLTMEEAIAYAYGEGVTIVAAAGNDGLPTLLYPAAYDAYVIAVGATQYDETKAPYSNYGPSLDIVAPGGNTEVDQNNDGKVDGVLQQTFRIKGNTITWNYWFFSGTSMAAPHVSGVAALLISKGNARTPDEVRAIIQGTADDLGSPDRDDNFGWGLVNASRAVNAPYRYEYIHTITRDNIHSLGENVNDTVTISSGTFAGVFMEFNWIRPDNSNASTSVVSIVSNRYSNEYIPDVPGTWRINVTELDSSYNQVNNINNPNQTSFIVIDTPEFSTLGLTVPLFLAVMFYMQLKRKIR